MCARRKMVGDFGLLPAKERCNRRFSRWSRWMLKPLSVLDSASAGACQIRGRRMCTSVQRIVCPTVFPQDYRWNFSCILHCKVDAISLEIGPTDTAHMGQVAKTLLESDSESASSGQVQASFSSFSGCSATGHPVFSGQKSSATCLCLRVAIDACGSERVQRKGV